MPSKPRDAPAAYGDAAAHSAPPAAAPSGDLNPPAANGGTPPITDCVDQVMRRYFSLLNGERVSGVYQSVLDQVELPLLRCVLHYTGRNQSAAAKVLGISRATLRRKLEHHQLLP